MLRARNNLILFFVGFFGSVLLSMANAAVVLGVDMTLNGSAAVSGSNLQLTPNSVNQVGSAWATSPVSTTRSFTSSFTFQLNGGSRQAEGITFALQGTGLDAIGGGGGGIGISGISRHVNLSIRTNLNNSIGLGNDTLSSKAAPNAIGSCLAIVGTFTVAYQAEHSVLALQGSYTACGSTFTVADSLSVNLESKFGSRVYLGFTGATGATGATQTVTAWSVTSTSDLVMHHQFDNSTGLSGSANADSSVNGFGGTFVGNATMGSMPSAYCGGLSWAQFSSGSRVEAAAHPALSPRPNFSVALWVRGDNFDAAESQSAVSITPVTGSPKSGFLLSLGRQRDLRLLTGAGTSEFPFWSQLIGGILPLGQWVHIAATFQATSGPDSSGVYTGTGRVYVNGAAVGLNTAMRYLPSSNNSLNVGANSDGSNSLRGAADDVRLYARVLSSSDIKALMVGTCPGGVDGVVWWARAGGVAQADNTDMVAWLNEANAAKSLSGSPTRPKFRNSNAKNINFNPVVEFTSTTASEAGAQYFSGPSLLGSVQWSQAHYVMVGYTNSTQRSSLFQEATASGSDALSIYPAWNDRSVFWNAGNNNTGTNRLLYTEITTLMNKPSVWLFNIDTVSLLPDGASQGIRKDGVIKTKRSTAISFTGRNSSFRVAYPPNFTEPFRGVLAEGMLFLGNSISSTQATQLESYLGVKFGATLGGNGATGTSYLDSAGRTIWSAGTGYHHNIVGIGRDDSTKLNQLISRSVNSGDQVTIISGSAMPPATAEIAPTTGASPLVSDRSYAILGDNGQSTSSTTVIAAGPLTGVSRSARVWRLQVTGSVPAQLSICIPDTMLPSSLLLGPDPAGLALIVSKVADFSADTAQVAMTAATCVGSGVGVANGLPGRIATVNSDIMTSLGGVGFVAIARSPLLDHIEITAGSNAGLTCSPTVYTIKACADSSCSSLFTGGLTGTLTLSGSGVVTLPSGGALFTIASGASSTTVNAQVLTASTATVGASGLSTTPANAKPVFCGLGTAAGSDNACVIAIAEAGFVTTVNPHYAGIDQSLSIQAVKRSDANTACVPAFANVTRSLRASCTYLNPSTGTRAPTLTATNGTWALNASNNASSGCDATGQLLPLAFDASGIATTTLRYWDAGESRLNLDYIGSVANGDEGLQMSGGASYITAPSHFSISNLPNSAVAAGATFDFTVSAQSRGSNGSFTTLPNFGQEVPAQTLQLGFARTEPNGAAAVNGTFAPGSIGRFTGGSATISGLSYSEVGSILVTVALSDYLGSGLAGEGSGAVRFKPYRLDISTAGACGSFSYAGQPFGVSVTAKNRTGATTLNYDGSANTSPNYSRFVNLTDATDNSKGSLTGHVPASSFKRGVASLAATSLSAPVFTFSSKLTSPQTINVRATDTDGVNSNGTNANQTLRSGRLQMSNAFGGDKASLQIPLQLQYWSGQSWVKNNDDDCTVIPTSAVVLARSINHNNSLATWSSSVSGVYLNAGSGYITLAPPSPLGTGTVDLSVNLGQSATDMSCLENHPPSTPARLPWLRSRQGSCASSFDRDPSARGSFGVYSPESRKVISIREIY